MALRYSTAKISLGWIGAKPIICCKISCRTTANGRCLSCAMRQRSCSVYSCESNTSAQRASNSSSALSLPQQKVSAQPSASAKKRLPNAKSSAVAKLHRTGSSIIRSTPLRTAAAARSNLSAHAGCPRCTKLPDITATTASAPIWRICRTWY